MRVRDNGTSERVTRPDPSAKIAAMTQHTGRFVLALGAALAVYNGVVHLTPGYDFLYVPLSLAVAGAVLMAGRRHGLAASDLGLEGSATRFGLRWGGYATAVAVAVLGTAVAIPALHGLLDDARVAEISIGGLLYRTLIRIPLGTVVLEEVAFRGVLFGAWARWRGTMAAAVGSSVVFGLWHIRPALELLAENDLAEALVARVPTVAAAVALTTAAGLVFCFLRIRSRSLLAPFVAHAAINSLATLAAFAVRSS